MEKPVLILFAAFFIFSGSIFADDETIIGQWDKVKAPPVVDLKTVKVDASSTALLILDIEKKTVQSRPRAVAAVPKIKKLLEWARADKILVVYSITKDAGPDAVLPEVKQEKYELVVKSGVDKYFGTDLEKHLKKNGNCRRRSGPRDYDRIRNTRFQGDPAC